MPDAERFVELIEGEIRLMADLFGADKVETDDEAPSSLKFQPANMNVA